MAALRILQYPDPRLRIPATPVTVFDDALQRTIDDMFDTLYGAENCAGLAATQLDLEKPPKITVIDFSKNKDQPTCLVNVEILERSGETYLPEGCKSVAGNICEPVRRAEKINVRALDRHGKPLNFEADGFMAKCIQHELDHLEGILFIDYLSPLKKKRIDRKVQKALRRLAKSGRG